VAVRIGDVPCEKCVTGYGHPHECESPRYCACDQAALHVNVSEDLETLDQALQRGLAEAHRARVAACVDHDLAGPSSGGAVFATCRRCGGRFKVAIEPADPMAPDPEGDVNTEAANDR
jgi:hypothetical protein